MNPEVGTQQGYSWGESMHAKCMPCLIPTEEKWERMIRDGR